MEEPIDKKAERPKTQRDLTFQVVLERKKILEHFFERGKWYVKIWNNREADEQDVDEALYSDFFGPFDDFSQAEKWSRSVGFNYTDAEGQLSIWKDDKHLMASPSIGDHLIDEQAAHDLRHWKPTKIIKPEELSESKYLS